MMVTKQRDEGLLALDEALDALAESDFPKSQMMELRFFGGLNMEETVEDLDVSVETVHADWRLTRSSLQCRPRGEGAV